MKWRPRLSLQIGLLYTALAAINIAFFAFMILENQMDLLQNTFRYHSRSLIQTVVDRTDEIRGNPEFTRAGNTEQLLSLDSLLQEYEAEYALVFDASGKVLHSYQGSQRPPNSPGEKVMERSRELRGREMLFRERFSMELYEENWAADVILPLENAGTEYYLNVRLRIASMQDRIQELYWQVALAILWGVVFHILFGVFVYRIIFRRLGLLKEASGRMQTGDLSSRAPWSFERGDELDDLGKAFNDMAGSIEEKMHTIQSQLETISRLNLEMQNELDIGQDVQQAFFPDFGAFEKYNPAFVFLPLRQVSGDMCNLYRFDDGSLGVFLGDAAGHGVSGALITALVTSSMDRVLETVQEPGKVMETVNAELCRRLTSTFFATGIYVLLGPDALSFSGAGHVDCLLYRRKKDSFVHLESQGTPIGLFEDMRYPQGRERYDTGDRLLLFSDGLTEAVSDSGQLGMEGAERLLRDTINLKGNAFERAIQDYLHSFRSLETDDITILALDL